MVHLVFLVDTSDSFNKLDQKNSSAGKIIIEKLLHPMLSNGKYSKRTAPTTVTVVQFSGISGIDKDYQPGSGGAVVQNSKIIEGLYHYRVCIPTKAILPIIIF